MQASKFNLCTYIRPQQSGKLKIGTPVLGQRTGGGNFASSICCWTWGI